MTGSETDPMVSPMPDERDEWIVGKTQGYYRLLEGKNALLTAVDIKTLVPKSTREAAEAERDEARERHAVAEARFRSCNRRAEAAEAERDEALRKLGQMPLDLKAEYGRAERLREALKGVGEQACREWVEDKANYCFEPAEFVLWGKLLKPEALGPRCYDHAAKHVGHHGLAPGANFALIDLRKARAALSPREDA